MRKARPLVLAGNVAVFAIAGYVAIRLGGIVADPLRVLVWFLGAIVLHDLVLFPIYSAVDRIAERGTGRVSVGVNVVRVPALLSGLLLLVWFPLILSRDAALYGSVTGVEQPDYLARWLLITGALFAASPLVAVALHRRTRRRAAPTDRAPGSR